MSDSMWTLLPSKGIEQGDIQVTFGQERPALREALSAAFLPPEESDYPDEGDFHSKDGSTFIRVRYDGTTVRDIEFLSGSLSYQDVALHAGTTFGEIEKRLGALGFTFRSTEWLGDGMDCPGLGVNIATRDDVGGDGDGIEWVILSGNFD